MKKNILLKIAYDGSGFHGWQRQPGDRTVQGELEKTLSHVLGKDICIDGTSRTDAGVHAYGQQASFQCDINIPVEKLPMILNNSLSSGRIFNERIPGEISIIDAKEMPHDFHARFSATGKTYTYKILVTGEKNIFKRNYFYQIEQNLDVTAMQDGAEYIVGKKDFKAFETSGGTERETTVRTVNSLIITEEINKDDKLIQLDISGDGFLYNMVRIITGTLVEVGMGKRKPESVRETIESCSRENAGHTAPPHGLYLKEVYYEF